MSKAINFLIQVLYAALPVYGYLHENQHAVSTAKFLVLMDVLFGCIGFASLIVCDILEKPFIPTKKLSWIGWHHISSVCSIAAFAWFTATGWSFTAFCGWLLGTICRGYLELNMKKGLKSA